MILYLDTSALVKAYVQEAHSRQVLEGMRSATTSASHVIAYKRQGSSHLLHNTTCASEHNDEYRKKTRGYLLRHKVCQGIAGWAQIHGWRGATETLDKMQHRVDFDLEYIRRWS